VCRVAAKRVFADPFYVRYDMFQHTYCAFPVGCRRSHGSEATCPAAAAVLGRSEAIQHSDRTIVTPSSVAHPTTLLYAAHWCQEFAGDGTSATQPGPSRSASGTVRVYTIGTATHLRRMHMYMCDGHKNDCCATPRARRWGMAAMTAPPRSRPRRPSVLRPGCAFAPNCTRVGRGDGRGGRGARGERWERAGRGHHRPPDSI